MHEYSIVESVVQGLVSDLQERGIDKVVQVRFRRGSAFSEDALRQAFEMLSAGTLLEGAQVVVETVNLDYKCACGHEQVINSDDLVGHMFVCPKCQKVREVDESHDLELLDVTVEEPSGE